METPLLPAPDMSNRTPNNGPVPSRLDQWLWQARFLKSRSAAAEVCHSGLLRINGRPVNKAGEAVRIGDVLTIPLHHSVRVVRVQAFGRRRGPAAEAAQLYEEI